MIQRIQTLYLLLTTILPLLFLKFKLLTFSGKDRMEYYLGFKGLYSSETGQSFNLMKQLWPVSLLIILISACSLVAIFLFRNRKFQMRITLLIIIFSAGLIASEAICSAFIMKQMQVEITPGFAMVLPMLMLLFSILAFRCIRKDENLVRSYDRLR